MLLEGERFYDMCTLQCISSPLLETRTVMWDLDAGGICGASILNHFPKVLVNS